MSVNIHKMNSYHIKSYPQQVSSDQANEGKSEIAFSNGYSYSSLDTESKIRNGNELLLTDDDFFRQRLPDSRVAASNVVHTNQSSRPIAPPRYEKYRDYSERLRSYARWIQRHPDPTSLSSAGFFFTSNYTF